jgi:UBA-like domain
MASLDYPNLATCKIRLKGGVASARPPVVLPRGVREAASQMNIDDTPYDFSLGESEEHGVSHVGGCSGTTVIAISSLFFHSRTERHILKRKEERDQDRIVQKASSREELQSSTVTKMKNLTGADESVCVAILEKNNYDVTTSIEAFFLENGS